MSTNLKTSFKRNILYIVEGSDEELPEEPQAESGQPEKPAKETQGLKRIQTEYTRSYGAPREIKFREEPTTSLPQTTQKTGKLFAVDTNSYVTSFRGPPPALVMMKESIGEYAVQKDDEDFGNDEFTFERKIVSIPQEQKPKVTRPKNPGSKRKNGPGRANGASNQKEEHKNGHYKGNASKFNFAELYGENKHNVRRYNGGPEYWEDIEEIDYDLNDEFHPHSHIYSFKKDGAYHMMNANGGGVGTEPRNNNPSGKNQFRSDMRRNLNVRGEMKPEGISLDLEVVGRNHESQKGGTIEANGRTTRVFARQKPIYPRNTEEIFLENESQGSFDDLEKPKQRGEVQGTKSFGADEFGVDFPSQEFRQPNLRKGRAKPDEFILKGKSKEEILKRADQIFGVNSVHTGPQRALEDKRNNDRMERAKNQMNLFQKKTWQNKYVTRVLESDEENNENQQGYRKTKRKTSRDDGKDEIDSVNSSEEEAIVLEKALQSFEDEPLTASIKSLERMSSDEQRAIRDAVMDHDVIVEAVAGSGKTTTILLVADSWEKAKRGDSVLLTYNKRLRAETQERAKRLGLNGLEVHTLHSFCWKFYPGECSDDAKMNEVVKRNWKPKLDSKSQESFKPTFFIIDEAQDLNDLYFQLIVKILRDFNFGSRIMMLGDRFQMIYEYRGADWRYFWMADELLKNGGPGRPRDWVRMPLTTSYRVHDHLAHFVNNCLLHQDLIVPGTKVKSDLRPIYGYDNLFNPLLWNRLHNLISRYKDNDVFILAYSIKSRGSPMRKFADWLSEKGHHVHMAEENETLSSIVMKDKIVFTTFHQSKGLERKLVVIFGFDAFLYETKKSSCFKGHVNGDVSVRCPNEVYVAVTRSKEKCVMLQGEGAPPLKCIASCENLEEFADLWGNVENGFGYSEIKSLGKASSETTKEPLDEKSRFHMGVKDLANHLPYNIAQKAKEMVRISQPNSANSRADQTHTIAQQFGGKWESVSMINSVGVPLLAELRTRGTASLLIERVISSAVKEFYIDSVLKDEKDELFERAGEYAANALKSFTSKVSDPVPSIPETLFIANEYCSVRSGSSFKLRQIQDYNWLSEFELRRVFENLSFNLVSAAFNFTVFLNLEAKKFLEASGFNTKSLDLSQKDELLLYGQVDIMTKDDVIMIKGSGSIRDDDIIRMIALAFLLENKGKLTRAFHPMANLSEHHEVVSRISETLISNYSDCPEFKPFARESAIRIKDEMLMMSGFEGDKSKKRYIILNPFSGEKVQVKFESRDHLNSAMRAILDYKLSTPDHIASDEQFVNQIKATLSL